MKLLLLTLVPFAFAAQFQSHSSCTGYDSSCGGSTGDASTCLGQDAIVTAAMAAEGIDVTAMATSWTTAAAQALARNGYRYNWDNNGVFNIHTDLERLYRCTIEANNLVWSVATACFDEWGSCLADPVCAATWDGVANSTAAAAGVTFTRIGHSVQALGALPFTPINDLTTSPFTMMDALQLGTMVAISDMSGNGKIMAMNACMLKNWVVDTTYPTGVDIQTAYQPCFDLAVACSNNAECVATSTEVAKCAEDKDVAMETNSMLTNLKQPSASASHDDWCAVADCGSAEGNSLFLALGTCLMDAADLSFKKCYDDTMKKLFTMMLIIGGGSFSIAIMFFTAGWCMCCRNKHKVETEV